MSATFHLSRPMNVDGVSLPERIPALMALRVTAVAAWLTMRFTLTPSVITTRLWLGALLFVLATGAFSALGLAGRDSIARLAVPLCLTLDGLFFEGRYAHGAPLGGNIIVAVYIVAIAILLPPVVAVAVGIWHTVLAVFFTHVITMAPAEHDSIDPAHNIWAFVGVLWLALVACIQLKALNERELRRRRRDAEALRRFALSLASLETVADAQQRLLDFCLDELKAVRAAWITPVEPYGFRLELGRNVATAPTRTDIGVSELLSPLAGNIPARAVYQLGPGEDGYAGSFPTHVG